MTHLDRLRCLTQRFKKDEEGSLALMFSVSALTLIMAAGAAYDINQLHASKAKAQLVSDSVGLAMTAYVKNHGKPPQNSKDGYQHNKTYSAKSEGFNIGAATEGKNDVKFRVLYDNKNGQAVVHMEGQMETSFMSMFGQNQVTFRNKTVVKYSQSDVKDPASVFLVMDNSGSMGWDDKPRATKYGSRPAGAQRRIDGLTSTVKDFNAYLGKAVTPDPSNPSVKFLRMGMTSYNSSLISTRTVLPLWGTLSNGHIQRMTAGGGTDSRQSMALARTWMKGENRVHKAMNGVDKPLKYVIFMTDGVNNQQRVCEWENRRGTQYWRKRKGNGSYKYKWSRYSPGRRGWEEGREACRYVSKANDETLKTCTQMKNEGVEVYTIGYALEPGTYATSPPSNRYSTTQSETNTDVAYKFLESCASSSDHFVKATNTDGLKAAFDKIGADIATDVIRIAS